MEPNVNVSLFVEIPEALHETLTTFLDTRPDWDQDRVFSAALALFLLQNRPANERQNDRATSRIYLDSIFKRPVEFLVPNESSSDVTPLQELKLSKRAHNCLTRVGVATIQELEKMKDEELLEISNFGAGCLAEVREALQFYQAAQTIVSQVA